jgi:hypothetical protein
MSRIAQLEPPYAPEIQEQFDRIMRGAPPLTLFRVLAGNARASRNSAPAASWTAARCHCGNARSSSTGPAR